MINKLKVTSGQYMTNFKGYSTIGRLSPPYGLTDIELIKRDLLNEFHTRLGERVMRPEFGTIIYDLLMDPGDDITKSAIRDDAIRIVKKDPRVELDEVTVTDHEDAVIVQVDLYYGPHSMRQSLYISYQTETLADYQGETQSLQLG